jgi:integrase
VVELAEMYNQGVSTCKVKVLTEQMCDQSFSSGKKDDSHKYDQPPRTDLLCQKLSEHRRRSDNHEWVFPNPKNNFPYVTRLKCMKRICIAAGFNPFGLHSIRHLNASILIQQKVSLIDIQTILRHKNNTTA